MTRRGEPGGRGGACSRFVHAGVRWVAQADAAALVRSFAPGFTEPALRAAGDVRQEKSGRLSVVLAGGAAGWSRAVFVKVYRPRHLLEPVKYLFKRTRAAAEWRINGQLNAAGVPTAARLAWGEVRRAGVWSRSVLVTEAVVPPLTLNAFLAAGRPAAEVRAVVRRAAACVAALHEAGYRHPDLHGDNILVRESPRGAELAFVDLHEIRRAGGVGPRGAQADLARLNAYASASLISRLRFLRAYLRGRGLPGPLRAWAAGIDRRTRRIWARHFRKRGTRIERY